MIDRKFQPEQIFSPGDSKFTGKPNFSESSVKYEYWLRMWYLKNKTIVLTETFGVCKDSYEPLMSKISVRNGDNGHFIAYPSLGQKCPELERKAVGPRIIVDLTQSHLKRLLNKISLAMQKNVRIWYINNRIHSYEVHIRRNDLFFMSLLHKHAIKKKHWRHTNFFLLLLSKSSLNFYRKKSVHKVSHI
jgi:hypothetical protein